MKKNFFIKIIPQKCFAKKTFLHFLRYKETEKCYSAYNEQSSISILPSLVSSNNRISIDKTKGKRERKIKKKRKFVRPWQKSTLQLRLKNLVASSLESMKQRFPRKSLETFKTVTILHQIQHYIVNETLDEAHSKRTASAPILPIQITRHC